MMPLHELLRTEYGLDLTRGGAQWALAEHVESRLGELGSNEQDLLDRVLANLDGERERLVRAVTVRHTWFFRDPEQLDEIAEFIQLRWASLGRAVDVWVAGCATGEEAWTLAMIAGELGVEIRLLATDVDARAIAEARLARYTEDQLRELPPTMRRWFEREADGRWRVDQHRLLGERCKVEFAVHNLCDPPPALAFDLICCRNVLIYFEFDRASSILDQLRTRLLPYGRLVLGGADQLTDPSTWRPAVRAPEAHAPVEPTPFRQTAIERRVEPTPDQQAMTRSSEAIAAGRSDDAIALLETLVADQPLQAEPHFWIGLAHHHAGRPEQAIPAFRRASCLTPELWPASLFAALAHEHRGDHRAAQRCWISLTRALEQARPPPIVASLALIAALPAWRGEALALARLRSSQDLEGQSKS